MILVFHIDRSMFHITRWIYNDIYTYTPIHIMTIYIYTSSGNDWHSYRNGKKHIISMGWIYTYTMINECDWHKEIVLCEMRNINCKPSILVNSVYWHKEIVFNEKCFFLTHILCLVKEVRFWQITGVAVAVAEPSSALARLGGMAQVHECHTKKAGLEHRKTIGKPWENGGLM